jgi:hypothetical protein
MARPTLRQDLDPAVTEIVNRGVYLHPCPQRQCNRCGKYKQLRSYTEMCEECFSEMAQLAFWNGSRLVFTPHARRGLGCRAL